jgi:hypothetical protein
MANSVGLCADYSRIVLTHADQLFYPLELCIDFDLAQSNGIRWILHDQTYLYFTLFFSSAINDAVLRQPYGKQTLHYLGRTIASLNAKLARNELEDPTVSIVSSLVIVSAALTDYNASKTHFEGLGQMVQLRGGLGAFRHNMGLYLKLTRSAYFILLVYMTRWANDVPIVWILLIRCIQGNLRSFATTASRLSTRTPLFALLRVTTIHAPLMTTPNHQSPLTWFQLRQTLMSIISVSWLPSTLIREFLQSFPICGI